MNDLLSALRLNSRNRPGRQDCRRRTCICSALRCFGIALTVIAVAGSSGCTQLNSWFQNGFKVGPEYCKPAAPVADQWIDFNKPEVISSPTDDREWWKAFNDPTLDSLIQTTYQGNLPLHAQGQRVLEYQALRAIYAGNLFPQAQSLDGFYKHLQISQAGNLSGVPKPVSSFDLWNIGPALQWELDVWGKYRRRIEQADAEVEREVELYDDLLSIAVADTAKAYASFRTAQEYVRLARQNVEIQKGSLNIAEIRFKEGGTGELDVQQAKSTLQATEALIPQFQKDLRKANNELCILLGTPPHDLTTQIGDAPIPVAPNSVAVGIPGELMRRRPDIRAAERAVARASAEIGVSEADLYPHFSIEGGFSWTANQLPDVFGGQAFGGIVGPSFRWDILNYGRLKNNVRRYEARFQKTAIDYQQTVLNANREVENALISFLKSREQADRLQGAVEATKKSVELALIQYREGAIDFERVFNLQNVLVRHQIDEATARAEISLSLIDLYRALRGGWQIRLDQPTGAPAPVAVEIPPAIEKPPELPAVSNPPPS